MIKMFSAVNTQSPPLLSFSDSSWNELTWYVVKVLGGIVDHSPNLPDPVALSSAKTNYNDRYIAFMADSHLRMNV